MCLEAGELVVYLAVCFFLKLTPLRWTVKGAVAMCIVERKEKDYLVSLFFGRLLFKKTYSHNCHPLLRIQMIVLYALVLCAAAYSFVSGL